MFVCQCHWVNAAERFTCERCGTPFVASTVESWADDQLRWQAERRADYWRHCRRRNLEAAGWMVLIAAFVVAVWFLC